MYLRSVEQYYTITQNKLIWEIFSTLILMHYRINHAILLLPEEVSFPLF